MTHLVNFFEYTDEIASFMHAKPNLLRCFLQSPIRWWHLVTAPWTAFQYLVERTACDSMMLSNAEAEASAQLAMQRVIRSKPSDHYAFHVFHLLVLLIDVLVGIPVLLLGLYLMYHLTVDYPWGWGLL
jgi:hypothetical protein